MKRQLIAALLSVLALVIVSPVGANSSGSSRRSGPSFSGNGGQSLPPFRVSVPSTLFWQAGGDIFQIFNSGGGSNDGSVNSQAHSGWTYIPPGTYALQVNTVAGWSFRVVAGAVHPKPGNGGLMYQGNGGMALPPFTPHHNTTLFWVSQGAIFQIFSSDFYGGGDVNSQAHSGSTYLQAGTHRLYINTTGGWVIGWRL